MYRSRWNKVKAYLKKKRMDAFIVRGASNIRYLYASHLPHDSSLATFLVIFRKGNVAAITSSLEAHRTKSQGAPGAPVHIFSSLPHVGAQYKNFNEALQAVLKKGKAKKAFCDAPMKVKGIKVQEDDILGKIRAIKDEQELKCIKAACKITDLAAAKLEELLVPGASERSVHRDLNYIMGTHGADSMAFETIVASGPHSAYPHHDLSDRKLKKGDPVTCDFGAVYKGYCADLTRTYFVGKPSKELAAIYNAVFESYKAGVKASKAGAQLGSVDKACRDVVVEYGYGKYFVHSTGHGVGLDVHEEPRVIPGLKEKILTGMVFTVEPGIYVPGVGGARIENDVYISPKGPVVLNKAKIPTY
jgi:Xaa-Pro aminopeptidase